MQLKFVSINVEDQSNALDFLYLVLGFTKMADFTNGDYRWLTVVSPDGIEGVELVLNPLLFLPPRFTRRPALRLESLPPLSQPGTSKRITTSAVLENKFALTFGAAQPTDAKEDEDA